MRYLIRNGMIADGTGKDCFAGSVLIQDNKIEAVFPGRDNAQAMAAAQNAQVVDAQGGYITPGFIDIHRHGDWKALTRGDDELLCRQGITSVVNGNCGLSAAPQGGAHEEETEHFLRSFIGAKPQTAARADEAEGALPEDPAYSMETYLSCLGRVKRSVHTGMLVGGGTVRAGVAGYGSQPLTEDEEEQIRQRIVQSLDAGALGVSLGMGYEPEYAYDEAGLVRVLEPLRGRDIPVAVHIRTEGDGSDKAVEEMIRVCRALDVPLHLSHMKCIGKRNWRVTCERELELVRKAREEGLDVTMDTYPYITGSTQLVHLIPPGFQSKGTQALLEYLSDLSVRRQITEQLKRPSGEFENIVELAGFENIAVTGVKSSEYASHEGRTILEIAGERNQDPYDALYDILLAERCECAMLDTYGCEEDLIDFLKDETCSLISDAIYPEGGHCHPRVYDSFPRFLIRYVREKQVFTIEEAIRKMTALPADVYHLDRGTLEPGKEADVCVFHLENLKSHADFSHPERMCTGFDYVFTAGVPVVTQDRWTGERAGNLLLPRSGQNRM